MDKRFQLRAWHKPTGTMYAKVYDSDGDEVCVYFPIPDELGARGMCDKEANFVLMQCTGLTDKDGRDIYEGDIVDIHGERFEIEEADACFWIHKTDYSMEMHTIIGKIDHVIGNIYENSEMMEGENG
jgi:uncharacterized phage protein (TIGR01671 family)